MNIIKKAFLSTLSLFVLTLSLSGCNTLKKATPAVPFNEFIKALPQEMISSDDMNLEFLFNNPLDFGFEDQLYKMPFEDLATFKEIDQICVDITTQLHSYDYKKLSASNQAIYDSLNDYVSRNDNRSKFYYLDNSYLGSFIGFQSQLPLLLTNYTFDNKRDFDNYFNILSDMNAAFVKYYEMEKLRQEKGVGLSKTILKKVIEQCDNLIKKDTSFINNSFNTKVNALAYLDETQKTHYIKMHDTAIQENLISAYQTLRDNLSTIKSTNPSDLGLSHTKYGKAYYEYLIETNIGADMSVVEIESYLRETGDKIIAKMKEIKASNPQVEKLITQYMNNSYSVSYTTKTSTEDTINYLKTKISDDFPDLQNLKYEVQQVPEAMKDNFSPAAYLQGKIDALPNQNEIIIMNGDFNQDLFDTISHEAYPGHLYQHSYFKEQKMPLIMYLLETTGYSEGWATYVDTNAWRYIEGNADEIQVAHYVSLLKQYSAIITSLMDIGIHYEGWDYSRYEKEMQKYYDTSESLKEQYYYNLETPANYLQYTLSGLLIQDMFDRAKSECKDKFSAKAFHEAILRNGPCSIVLLNKRVDAYIKKTNNI